MGDNAQRCRNCPESDYIIVKDVGLADACWRSGNPYQFWCHGCHSFKHAASKAAYERADTKYIILPDEDEPTELENEFDCPECSTHLYQFPDECTHCGAEYNW